MPDAPPAPATAALLQLQRRRLEVTQLSLAHVRGAATDAGRVRRRRAVRLLLAYARLRLAMRRAARVLRAAQANGAGQARP